MSGRHAPADRLHDYVDDLLCREERAELELHLAACAECTAEVLALRELRRSLAGLPAEIAPERDLLTGINAAIDALAPAAPRAAAADDFPIRRPGAAPATESRSGRGFGERSLRALRYPLAAAALALIALTSAITVLLLRNSDGQARAAAGAPAAGAAIVSDNPVVRQVLRAEPSYVAAAAELEALLQDRWTALDPVTREVVAANLLVIERALAEARAALAQDPENASLARLLDHARAQQLDLLRRATRPGT